MSLSDKENTDFTFAVFGHYALNKRKRSLTFCGERVKVEPLIYDLLVYFIQHRDRVISRDELCREIWQQEFVDNNAINRAVSELRRSISKHKFEGEVIRTHYKKGYSFNLEVQLDPRPSLFQWLSKFFSQTVLNKGKLT
ncbi:winged helix-turn-helix domain-containing protein [Pseudoalteromonas luteoviolacea]|uniref:OmpR/PhoB-type domain-containing protein n=1 Tax=Pseudoalteromonas luteoviolacea NCIMB 1942 TaxID=1365253 RepID=A0A166Z3I4_9GAMM|nr:winged helix-turn-helix domain-containing protein [Pseudoalteromonas luteoviolacea]KZN43795.1 hypothetical protein N482_18370 [Pseudoalteromonas luteoviolacea NCIMB 1942]KZX01486.1 hypothetical protein JL49_05055 [Pseudoalteromonas luteoviolacea]